MDAGRLTFETMLGAAVGIFGMMDFPWMLDARSGSIPAHSASRHPCMRAGETVKPGAQAVCRDAGVVQFPHSMLGSICGQSGGGQMGGCGCGGGE